MQYTPFLNSLFQIFYLHLHFFISPFQQAMLFFKVPALVVILFQLGIVPGNLDTTFSSKNKFDYEAVCAKKCACCPDKHCILLLFQYRGVSGQPAN
jgi:hypothetical protein